MERDALSAGVLLDWLERVSGPSATAVAAKGGEDTGEKGKGLKEPAGRR